MLRLRTKVTTSPLVSRRSSSATSATRASSGPRAEQGDDLVDADLFAREHAVEHLADRAAGARRARERQQLRRRFVAARRPRVVAREAFAVGTLHHGEAQIGVHPRGVVARTRDRS